MMDREPVVKTFSYTDDVIDRLEAALSHERLGTYLNAGGGDREKAIRLHVWNTTISAAFYGPLQGLELALRNAVHGRLSERYGPAWYDNPAAGLDKGALERVERAKTGLLWDNREMKPAQVVAALSFGFWVSLLGPGGRIGTGRKANYEMTLWRPAIRGAFPHRTRLNRRQAHRPLDRLRDLRNRIAHHEPIFERNLTSDHRQIVDVAGWISPTIQAWIEHYSQVPAIIEAGQRQLGVSALGPVDVLTQERVQGFPCEDLSES